jgi:hypothetical protein
MTNQNTTSATLDTHLLIVKPRKVVTACGIKILALYPQSETALAAKADVLIRYSEVPGDIACSLCRNRAERALKSKGRGE